MPCAIDSSRLSKLAKICSKLGECWSDMEVLAMVAKHRISDLFFVVQKGSRRASPERSKMMMN